MRELQVPGLRARGTKRLLGITQVVAGPPLTALAAGKYLAGMSHEEVDALRRDQGDYQKFNTIIPLHKNADGAVYYLDMGYMEPHGLIRSAFNAFADGLEREGYLEEGAGLRSAMSQAFGELAEPFAQQEIIFGALLELGLNSDKWGDAVRGTDNIFSGEYWTDTAKHLAKRFEPGISKPLRRTFNALQGEFASNLTTPPAWAEAGEFLGFRIRVSNPRKEYSWRLGRVKGGLVKADDDIMKFLANPNDSSEEELFKQWETFEERRKRTILDGGIATMDTRYRGNSEPVIEGFLKNLKFTKEEANLIRLGVYLPHEYGPTFMKTLQERVVLQALNAEDATTLWNRVQQRVNSLRRFSEGKRAEGVQGYRWER